MAKKCLHVVKTSGVVTLQAIGGTFGVSGLLQMWRNHAGSHLWALGGLETGIGESNPSQCERLANMSSCGGPAGQ